MAIRAVNRKTGEEVSWLAFLLWLIELFFGVVIAIILFIEKWAVALVAIAFFVLMYAITHGGVK